MTIRQRLRNAIKSFQKNTMGTDLAHTFRKYGNRSKPLYQDWSMIFMDDKEMFKGYPYAAIRKRSNGVATLATNSLATSASQEIIDKAKKDEQVITHPYLDLIDKSKTFSNYWFWYCISTYLDIKGVYYLLAVRAIGDNRIGEIQEFKLLNPYNIRRIMNKETGELGGYVELKNKGQLVREIPKEMIIEIRELNPFSDEDPYSIIDAAKNVQYTLQQAGDYTRHAIKNNMSAPGIITTDVLLADEEFANFEERVKSQEKGTPLFGNGAGSITWQDMQIKLNEASLDKINEVNRQELFAVTGVSKTKLGIEQSGVTRDTSRVQKEVFVEDESIPRLQLVVDAFNQDYKVYYGSEYEKNQYRIYIDNPLSVDREAEAKDIEIRKNSYDLYNTLVNKGYDREIAAKYAEGDTTLSEIGEPTNEPVNIILGKPVNDDKEKDSEDEDENEDENKQEEIAEKIVDNLDLIYNQLDKDQQGLLNQQQSALQNIVVNIEGKLVSAIVNKVNKNKYETEAEIINKKDRTEAERELNLALIAFYGVIITLYANRVLSQRTKEFGKLGTFKMNNDVRRYIKEISSKTSMSHINTIVNDAWSEIREKALTGATRQEIISELTTKFAKDISQTRAKAIARTETNRAFTMSQYQADIQFLKQNKLTTQAYKKWVTRSHDPCQFCLDMASQPPIPFGEPFASLGSELNYSFTKKDGSTRVRILPIDYEDVVAGNLHVNCACTYELIIK